MHKNVWQIAMLENDWLPFRGAFLHFSQDGKKTQIIGELAKHTWRIFQ